MIYRDGDSHAITQLYYFLIALVLEDFIGEANGVLPFTVLYIIAAGRHCQYVETASSANVATECSSTLQDYQNSLRVSCQGSASEAANLTWTPNENTPDTVYYQVNFSPACLLL